MLGVVEPSATLQQHYDNPNTPKIQSFARLFFYHFQALFIKPESNFFRHWPMKRGQLNIHPGVGGSLSSILADLEVLWGTAISNLLGIPLKDLKVISAEARFNPKSSF